ncbi:MAG: substrate-binding domain-containing protein [Prevotellaceae bacterium]|nr:substrate-binding domain-containing protein [Prevotellaceae bacterium]
MKKKILFCLAMIACLFIASCGNDEENAPAEKKKAIVTYLKNSTIDYWKQIESAINSECEAMNFKSIVYYVDDDSDIDGQYKAVSGIAKLQETYDIKGVIIAPIYTEGNHKVEESLADFISGTKIPVVIIDSPVDEKNNPLKNYIKAYVGTDNKTAGKSLAEAINVEASTVFAARIKNSTPTTARYEGFCEGIGTSIPIWETLNDNETPAAMTEKLADYANAQNLVFFNGGLCVSVLDACKGKNVYSFDAYKPLVQDMISENGCVKGIITQNTFLMGQKAAFAVIDNATSGNIFVPTIYVTRETVRSNEFRPFINYFGMSI